METSTTIEAPASVVYSNISDFETWKNWSTWHMMDPDMKITYEGPQSGLGAKYSWVSDVVGSGTQEIVEATPNEGMKTKLQFAGYDGFNYGKWKLEDAGEGKTTVRWGMESGQPFPFLLRGMMLFMNMEKSILDDFNKGLTNLKAYSEEQAAQTSTNMEIQKIDFGGRRFAAVQGRVKFADLQSFYANSYGAIQPQIAALKEVEAVGMPCGLYYDWDEAVQETTMAAAIPVNQAGTFTEPVANVEIAAGPAWMIEYKGNYDGLGTAHEAIAAYLEANSLEAQMPCIEEYVTDPGTEPDPSKWITKIYYLLK
ncbi:MAG: SRPBCC family protein [Phaeodactylibacter sp.]|nr:SRPBCC family protein [Phaeodactylibacter sp.]